MRIGRSYFIFLKLIGQIASIGIVKGKPFMPDARMKKILTDAATVGNATLRMLNMSPRDAEKLKEHIFWRIYGDYTGYVYAHTGRWLAIPACYQRCGQEIFRWHEDL